MKDEKDYPRHRFTTLERPSWSRYGTPPPGFTLKKRYQNPSRLHGVDDIAANPSFNQSVDELQFPDSLAHPLIFFSAPMAL
jgi:hypothetical protein